MYINWKRREFLATICSIFGRNRISRRQIRDKIRFHDVVVDFGNQNLVFEKYPERINIAFCFNDKGYKLAAVSIRSLVDAARNQCDYDIYCIVDQDVTVAHKKQIMNQVKHTTSRVIFVNANRDFDKSYRASWPVAVYYRMMLPRLLPNVDKIIYADIDIIFGGPLVDVYRIDMGENLVAGVRDYKNGYINSGFLVMNLKQMRERGVYARWIDVSRRKKYKNPDQDLLNYTSYGRIVFLPLKYNFQTMLGKWIFKTHSEQDISDLKYNLVVMHYSNWIKPWAEKGKRPIFSEYWWCVAEKTGLFCDE